MLRSFARRSRLDAHFMTENGGPLATAVTDADAVAVANYLACSEQGKADLAALIAVRLHAEQRLQDALGLS